MSPYSETTQRNLDVATELIENSNEDESQLEKQRKRGAAALLVENALKDMMPPEIVNRLKISFRTKEMRPRGRHKVNKK